MSRVSFGLGLAATAIQRSSEVTQGSTVNPNPTGSANATLSFINNDPD
jgi:hypothetical protein